MKHLNVFAALLAVLLLLSGCTASGSSNENSVTFYYIQSEIDLENPGSVIAPEVRDAESEKRELTAALNLYLQGPLSDTLRSPLPEGTALIRIDDQTEYLEVMFSDRLANLTGMELTLACSCIAKTCMGLTDATEVRISADNTTLDGASYIAITADSLLLTDDSTQ